MIPRRLEPAVFGFLLSGAMSLVVAGIATFRTTGWVADFLALWMTAWLTAWAVAFPLVLVAAPLARRWAHRLVARE